VSRLIHNIFTFIVMAVFIRVKHIARTRMWYSICGGGNCYL